MRYLTVATLVLSLAGCDGSRASTPSTPIATFAHVDPGHLYFPLDPGVVRIYEGTDSGKAKREETRVLDHKETIFGTLCTGIEQHIFLDGLMVSWSVEWFAQDVDGNVWKFAEESVDVAAGDFAPTRDSWHAGKANALPWIAFPANMAQGDRIRGAGADGPETIDVRSIDAQVSVPAGTFAGCVELEENDPDPDGVDDDTDIILYAPGRGKVAERTNKGSTGLKSTHRE